MQSTDSIFRSSNDGTVHRVLGMRQTYKVSSAETHGAYVSFEIAIPGGVGAPPHRHEIDSESFYVLDGEITFTDATGTRVARRGDFIFLPAGGEHAFVNTGDTEARALVVAAPGVEAERFFAEVDGAFGESAPDVDHLTAMAAQHGIRILSL